MVFVRGLIGIVVLLGVAFLLSKHRKKIDYRIVGSGLALQLLLAFLVLKVSWFRAGMQFVSEGFVTVTQYAIKGTDFIFGPLSSEPKGFVFALRVLPVIVFFSVITSILYHYRILPMIVNFLAKGMKKVMKISGVESLVAAGNIVIGQTEAPLMIKPYLKDMNRTEVFSIMTSGMATMAGSVLGGLIGMMSILPPNMVQEFTMHLLAASVISAPAALMIAKIMEPVTEPSKVPEEDIKKTEIQSTNVLEAISNGTNDGVKLAVVVGATVLVYMSLIPLFNGALLKFGDWTNLNEMIRASQGVTAEMIASNPALAESVGLTFQYLLGFIFMPIAWVIGIPSDQIILVGQFIGEKTVLNEFVAYASLLTEFQKGTVDYKTFMITTYALCGFANIGSIGIQIAGFSSMAENQKPMLAKLGFRSLIAGSIACFLTAVIASMFL